MARTSKETKELGETNRSTMQKCHIFELWVSRHLRDKSNIDGYQKAYNYIHKGSDNVEEATGLRSADED